MDAPGTTLRDTIAASFDEVAEGVSPDGQIGSEEPVSAPIGETEAQKTERLRDEAGRFAKAEAAKEPAKPAPTVQPAVVEAKPC